MSSLLKSMSVVVWLTLGLSVASFAATDCSLVTEIPQAECQALVDLHNNGGGNCANLVSIPPQVTISRLIQQMKGKSAYRL